MSRVVPRTPDSCGLLPWELVVALVRIREKESQVPIPREAARREWIQRSASRGRTRPHEGEDAGPAADPAGISRQVGAERLHHLAASRPNSAPLTPERGAVLGEGGGRRTEKLPTGPPPSPAPARGRGKLRAMTPLLVPTVGHPGDLQRGEGRRTGNELLLVRVPVGAPFIPLAHPPLSRRDGLIPSVASLRGRAPSSPQCQWGGAYTHSWGAKEGEMGINI